MLKSLTHIEKGTLHSLQELREWIQLRNQQVAVNVELIPLSQMDGWYTDEDGNLRHNSGHFFSIEGIYVQTDVGYVAEWDQPIINQPEIGYLGIIAKEFNGVLHFLMQAKIEPGNVNCVQISPSLQATKSNYTQQHKGRKPLYLEYFLNVKPHQVLLDQLQSEQGAWFLHKRNRNIIIKVDEEVPTNEDFRWMTLGQIKVLMHEDNLDNMDTRTVIAGIDFGQLTTDEPSANFSLFGRDMLLSSTCDMAYQSMNDHLSWLADLKSNAVLIVIADVLYFYFVGMQSSSSRSISIKKVVDRVASTDMFIDNVKSRGFYDQYAAEFDYRYMDLSTYTLELLTEIPFNVAKNMAEHLQTQIAAMLPNKYFDKFEPQYKERLLNPVGYLKMERNKRIKKYIKSFIHSIRHRVVVVIKKLLGKDPSKSM